MPNPLADNVNQFRQSLQDFHQGIQQLQFQRVLSNANQQVRQIRMQETDENKQRQALSQVAQNLVFQTAGLGVPATTTQGLVSAIDPDKTFRQKLELMTAKAALGGTSSHGSAQIERDNYTFKVNAQAAERLINRIQATVKKRGTFENRYGDKQAAATLQSDLNSLATLIPKTDDPGTMASATEVENAKKKRLGIDVFANPEIAIQNLENIRSHIRTLGAARGVYGEAPEAKKGTGVIGLTPID